VSLLLAEGHRDARLYPVAVAWSEARIVRERHARRAQSDAVVMQTVIASMFSKEGGKAFEQLLRRMEDVG
jgi:hypothetical protein